MTTGKKSGIWMDHVNAHLMEYANPITIQIVISNSTFKEKENTRQNGESMMHNEEQQQQFENGVILPSKAEVF